MVKSKFKIGDSVRIIDIGEIYSTYPDMFIKLGFKNKSVNNYSHCGKIGTVFGISEHLRFSEEILVAVRDEDGDEYLIHQDGLVHEFDMTTNEGRLEYARKHYPTGTEYVPIDLIGKSYHNKHISINEPKLWSSYDIKVGRGLIYHHDTKQWAEIIKQENKIMETQKLSRQGLKEIHSVACPNWKDVLEHYGTRNPLEDYIELTQDEVDKMFAACTKEQLPIVSKYLKQDDGSVDLRDIKTDEYGMIIGQKYILRVDDPDADYKSFWLRNEFNWEIKMVNNSLRLIPTKKK